MNRVKQRSERSLDTMRERFVGVTTELLAERSDISLVLADIGSGDFAATGASAAHPDRVVNVGIREQLLIGVAAGMAHEGFVPGASRQRSGSL